jgi:hypothetical protein
MIFSLFSSVFANRCGKPLSQTIKTKSPLDRLNGFFSRYECEQNAKIVCFFRDSKQFSTGTVLALGTPTQYTPV